MLLISDRNQGVDVGSIIKTQVAVDLANGPTMPCGHRAKVLDVNVTRAGLTVVKIMDTEGQPRWITRDSVARA